MAIHTGSASCGLALCIAMSLASCGGKVQYDYKALGFANSAEMEAAFAKGYQTKAKLDEMTAVDTPAQSAPAPTPAIASSPSAAALPDMIDLGVISNIHVELIHPVTIQGDNYYVLDAAGQPTIHGTKHDVLNAIFNNGNDTSDDARVITAGNMVVTLLSTSEAVSLRNLLLHKAPDAWGGKLGNVATATLVAPNVHNNVSFETDEIYTDGGNMYDGVALVRVTNGGGT